MKVDRKALATNLEKQGRVCFDAQGVFGDDAHRVALDASGGDGSTFDREIVLTGDYKNRKFSVTRAHLDKIIANHQRVQVDPALDREHESWFSSDATEARGWVKSLRVEPSKMVAGREALVGTFELNDLGQHATKNKHFRYLSAGIDFNAKDRLTNEPIGAFLDHVAMCKHPYVQGMQPLTMTAGNNVDGEEKIMNKLLPVVLLALGMSAEVDEEKALAAFQKREQDKADEAKALAARAEKAEKDLADARTALKTVRAQIEKSADDKATADVDAAILATKFTPAEREDQIALAKADRALFDKLLKNRQPTALSTEIKVANRPATDQAALAAQEKAIDDEMKADPALSVAAAAQRASKKNPALFGATDSEGA